MSDLEQKASKGMITFVLAIFTIAMIIAVAYLAFFTPGQVEPGPKSPTGIEGGQ